MKYLFVGDVHNHNYIFNDVSKLDTKYNFDRIIFIGDYVDDWNTTNKESIETIKQVIKLKKVNDNKYTFLLGNHELSYLGYPCSGHQFEREDELSKLLKDNIKCFDICTSVMCSDKCFVCSHAGFKNDFIKDIFKDEYKEYNFYYHMVNINRDLLHNLEPFTKCSYMRGGHNSCSSCLWTDIREHINEDEYYIPYQIVGHSPVTNINVTKTSNGEIYFIDTHSTYRDGRNYGDCSYLMWDADEFRIINK